MYDNFADILPFVTPRVFTHARSRELAHHATRPIFKVDHNERVTGPHPFRNDGFTFKRNRRRRPHNRDPVSNVYWRSLAIPKIDLILNKESALAVGAANAIGSCSIAGLST